MTSPSERSLAACSGRLASAKAVAASRRFFDSRVRTAMTSSSERAPASLPATSALRTAARVIRSVAVVSSSRAFIAVCRSSFRRSFSVPMDGETTLAVMRKRPLIALAAGVAAAGAATFAYSSLIERNLFTLRRFDVPVLEPDAEPLRILHISDLHMMPDQRRKQAWVAALAGTDPDLVVVTGDNMSAPASLPGVLRALDPFLGMPAAFVFGSNDYRGPVWKNPLLYLLPDREYVQGVDLPHTELRAALVAAGWADLNNARTILKAGGRSVELAGVDDPHIE